MEFKNCFRVLACGVMLSTVGARAAYSEEPALVDLMEASIKSKETEYFYTGKVFEKDVDGYLFLLRTYSPNFSRWTTTDQKGFPDGPNNVIYVNNNALNAFDPLGADMYYSDGGGGHADVYIDNPNSPSGHSYYSYAPADGSGWDNPIGNLWTNGALTVNQNGVTIPSNTVRIPTTPEQDAAALAKAEAIRADPGTYSALLNNCADVARDILNSAGAINLLPLGTVGVDDPLLLMHDIRTLLGLPQE